MKVARIGTKNYVDLRISSDVPHVLSFADRRHLSRRARTVLVESASNNYPGGEMAAIGNPAITGNAMPHDSSVWSFTVTYTAHFTDNELNAEFDDAARLWENDGGNNERRTEYTPTTRFKATSRSIDRQIPITVGTGQLSTEIGDEEIFGQIWLRRVGQAAASDERFTSNGSVTVDD